MMAAEIIKIVFFMIPEAFILILAALKLLGLRARPGRLFIVGSGLGILTYVARSLLFQSNLHTPLVLVCMVAGLALGFELSVTTAITGCFLSFFLLLMGESLLVAPAFQIFGISSQAAMANPWYHVAFGWISNIFLIIAVAVCQLGRVSLVKAPESQAKQREG